MMGSDAQGSTPPARRLRSTKQLRSMGHRRISARETSYGISDATPLEISLSSRQFRRWKSHRLRGRFAAQLPSHFRRLVKWPAELSNSGTSNASRSNEVPRSAINAKTYWLAKLFPIISLGLSCLSRLAGRTHQTVRLHEHAVTGHLWAQRKADRNKSDTKDQAGRHNAPVGRLVCILK